MTKTLRVASDPSSRSQPAFKQAAQPAKQAGPAFAILPVVGQELPKEHARGARRSAASHLAGQIVSLKPDMPAVPPQA
ncbi:hypothetical protein [Hoeflea sp.]|uniref:hypothetical protein n=1 Tax=Hoeflea sp. TaxID=1940281 RepID=UPI0019C3C088|nr:hypothetical protein [Hoeflea sp.]MBC7283403.1 hypothetical protein [Hoeflea sp.]